MLSDLISERDTLEMELNRVLNQEDIIIVHKKIDFDNVLGSIVVANNKINTLTEYLAQITATNNVSESVTEKK